MNEKENKLTEVATEEIIQTDLCSENSLIMQDEAQLEASLKRADMMVKYLDTIRKLAINGTNVNDWINQSGEPYLTASGCNKIALTFGLKIDDLRIEESLKTDSKGEFIEYTCHGKGKWNNVDREEIGTASTRDDFFSKRKNQKGDDSYYLKLEDVDKSSVRKKSVTNLMNRIIKNLLGLSYTWDEVKEYSKDRITIDRIKSISRNSKKVQLKPESQKKKEQMQEMLCNYFRNPDGTINHHSLKKYLKSISTFEIDNKIIPGKETLDAFTEGQVNRHYNTILKMYNAAYNQQQQNNQNNNR